MKLLGIETKQVVMILEVPLEEMRKLHQALNITQLNVDRSNPDDIAAAEYLTNEFAPYIGKILNELGKEI